MPMPGLMPDIKDLQCCEKSCKGKSYRSTLRMESFSQRRDSTESEFKFIFVSPGCSTEAFPNAFSQTSREEFVTINKTMYIFSSSAGKS